MDLRFYYALFLRRIHWFLLVAIAVSAFGIFMAKILPTVYVANATLVVESEQIPDTLAASTVRTQASEQLQIIQQRILTRETLVDMANRLKIYAPENGGKARPQDPDKLVLDLRKRIKIDTSEGTGQATLVSVSFEAPTAAMAAAVTNEVVTLILKTDVEMRTGSARNTLEFFKQEVVRLEKDLGDRAAAILAFKQANKEALPDSLDFRRSQQATLQQQLATLQQDEADLKARRDRLVRLHDAAQAGGALNAMTPPQNQTPEQQQLRTLQDQLASQKSVLSPENPKIKMLESQIAALQKVVDGQASSGMVDNQGREMSAYEVQLADMDTQLTQMTERQAQVTTAMKALQETIDATPGNAIQLDALQRDYDNVKTQYDQAVANEARAETGESIETMAKGQRISVIEPAVAPTDPKRPNRKIIAIGGIVGGLVMGLGLVALIEFLHAGIRRPVEITEKLGIAVFATLPYMKTEQEIRRRRMVAALIVVLGLAVLVAVLWAVNRYYMPLDLLMDQVIRRFTRADGAMTGQA